MHAVLGLPADHRVHWVGEWALQAELCQACCSPLQRALSHRHLTPPPPDLHDAMTTMLTHGKEVPDGEP